jgi:hypothetical protein
MVLLAVLAVSGLALVRQAGTRLARAGFLSMVLAAAFIGSGAGYLLLSHAVAWPAGLALPLPLIWVTGTGLWLSRAPNGISCPHGRQAAGVSANPRTRDVICPGPSTAETGHGPYPGVPGHRG